jgi:hypothetical protein
MSKSLRKAAAEFEAHTKTALAPHIPPDLVRDLMSLHKMVSQAHAMAKSLKPKADKAWGDMEDNYRDMQKAFVDQGNHPDDFNSTPEGKQAEMAMTWAEDLAGILDPKDDRGLVVTYNLNTAEEALDYSLAWAQKGHRR